MNREDRRRAPKEERRAERASRRVATGSHDLSGERVRTSPVTFLKEVRAELKKVAWPSRKEVTSYTLVVLITTAVLTAIVFGIDWVIRGTILRLFG